MVSNLFAYAELFALRTDPERAIRLLDRLPDSIFAAVQRARFKRTLQLAATRSAFYREQFRRRGLDVRRIDHPSGLGDFFTTGEDLRTHDADQFLVGRPDTAFETTGTTSPVPKRVFFSRREIDDMGRVTALWLHYLGLRKDDRVLSAFDCSFWVSPWVLRSGLDLLRCFHVEAGKIDPAEFYDRARAYRPTALFGEPSWVVRLSEIARSRGRWPLKLIFAGGENIAESSRTFVEETWSAPLYLNYGQTESFGALGAECRVKDGYHRNDWYFFFEVDRPDADGYGEVVYTTLARDVMPLIRYRSNDVARLVDERCACGLSVARIGKIRGRRDEMIVCGMGNVGPWVFEEILRGIDGLSDEWQVEISHDGRRDVVEVRVELDDPARVVDSSIRRNLRDRFPDFSKNLDMQLYELRIAARRPGTLRGAGRKLRRLVDVRRLESSRAIGSTAEGGDDQHGVLAAEAERV